MMGIFLLSWRCQIRQMIQEIIDKYYNFIKDKKWTYQLAAEKIECSRTHLGRIFNGLRVPSMSLLMRMEEVMKNEK